MRVWIESASSVVKSTRRDDEQRAEIFDGPSDRLVKLTVMESRYNLLTLVQYARFAAIQIQTIKWLMAAAVALLAYIAIK